MIPKTLKFPIIILSSILILFSCNKSDIDVDYNPVGYIDGISITDLLQVNDSVFLFSGKTKDDEGRIGSYNINTRKSTMESTSSIVRDISKSENSYWACGDNMLLIKKAINGTSWENIHSFTYFFEDEMSDLKKIHAFNDNPLYAIGRKSMLNGNFYYPNPNPQRPFLCNKLQTGLNDMYIIDSTEAYIAGYGSIFHVLNNSSAPVYSNIGGENFTAVTISGLETLISCSLEGNIYRKSLSDSLWEKTLESKVPYKYLLADGSGNIIAIGDSKEIALSNDFGYNWTFAKYSNAKNITTVLYSNNSFWVGTSEGEIIKLNRSQI